MAACQRVCRISFGGGRTSITRNMTRGQPVREDKLEEFCMRLPGDTMRRFMAVAENRGGDPAIELAGLLRAYVERYEKTTPVRVSGVVEVYVKSLLESWMDWPPAREMGAEEFVESTVEEIHKKLVVTGDQARMVAFRVWETLREAPQAPEAPTAADGEMAISSGEEVAIAPDETADPAGEPGTE